MTPSPKRLLTPTECAIIHKLRKTGMPIHLIGKEIHRSKNLVSLYLKFPEKYVDKTGMAKESKGRTARSSSSPVKKAKKKIEKKKSSSASAKKVLSAEDTARFNKVSVEHRAVIKYLTKKGIGAACIFEDMQSVYGAPAPEMPAVQFWCTQYKQGRESIINDSRVPATKVTTSTASTKTKSFVSMPKSSAEKKLITIKFNSIKRHKT